MASVGFLALARPTFDVAFAEETSRSALRALRAATEGDIEGDAALAMDVDAVRRAASAIASSDPTAVVVFQASFADSTLVRAAWNELDCPLVLWAVPEARTGGRLRLNSFCGINLAAYVLAREGVDYRWIYRATDDPLVSDDLRAAMARPAPEPAPAAPAVASGPAPSIAGATVGLVGDHPDGFEPCGYDAGAVQSLFGVTVDRVELEDWFSAAELSASDDVTSVRSDIEATTSGLGEVDQVALERSLRLYLGLSRLVESRAWRGVATRCWPECFTEFGGAACAGNSMLSSLGVPGCCEADVYGDLTALLLGQLSDDPPLVADLVDFDRDSGTTAFWHCGLGPRELAGATPRAGLHSNRRKPLLFELPLKPGRVTVSRISQSGNQTRMLIGGGEMLEMPPPFSGTSGIARLDTEVGAALDTIMGHGLEHHYGIAYGDHRQALHSYAASVGISVIEL